MGRTTCTEPQCLYKGAFYFYLIINSIVQFVPSCKKRYVFKLLTAILAEFVSMKLSNGANPSGRSLAGIVGSNPAGGIEVYPL
jgi:hypothetical protein